MQDREDWLRDSSRSIGSSLPDAGKETGAESLPMRVLPLVASDESWIERCEYWTDTARRRVYYGPAKIFNPEGVIRCPGKAVIKTYSGCIHEHVNPIHGCLTHAGKIKIIVEDEALDCGSCLLIATPRDFMGYPCERHSCKIRIWKQVNRDGSEASFPV